MVSDVILVSDENTIDYISITNILGAQVYSKQLNQHHIKIDNNFPNGLYIISILQADVVETIKIKLWKKQ